MTKAADGDPSGPAPGLPVTYRPDKFEDKLSEIEGRLAELKYIDDGLAYLESESKSWWQEILTGTGMVSDTGGSIKVTFGETVPFTRRFELELEMWRFDWPWENSKADEVRAQLDKLLGDAREWAAEQIDAVRARVGPMTYPSVSMYDHNVIHPLRESHILLEDEVPTNFSKLHGSIEDWEGEAADNYITHFHAPFRDTVRSHQNLLQALTAGVITAQKIVESTQQSLMNVADAISQQLYQQLRLRSIEESGGEPDYALIIGTAGTAVLATVLGGAGLWAIGMSAVNQALTVASSHILEEGDNTLELFGQTAEELREALDNGIGQIERNMGDEYEELSVATQKVLDRVARLRQAGDEEDGRLIPHRPTLLEGVDGSTFHLP